MNKTVYKIKCCSYKEGKIIEEILFEDENLINILKEYEDFICGPVLSSTTLTPILDAIGYYCFDSSTILTKEIKFI